MPINEPAPSGFFVFCVSLFKSIGSIHDLAIAALSFGLPRATRPSAAVVRQSPEKL
jgi:hypothetical protein